MAESDSHFRDESIRPAFTLVELMVTIGIIAVLAAMTFAVAGSAIEAAKIAKTRSLIARLDALIMARYESYRFRRLPIQLPAGLTPLQAAQVRCDGIRQLMRMEMPDRWSDISDDPVPLGTTPPASLSTSVTMPRSAASIAYQAFWSAHPPNDNIYDPQAKCLYLLVTMGLEENDILENFSADEILQSPDGDGYNVFIGGFGEGIDFLRWAPGFIPNPVVPPNNQKILPPYSNTSQLQSCCDRDQTDPTGVYGNPAQPGAKPTAANTYALYPLLFSCGPDGAYMVIFDQLQEFPAFHYASTTPPNNPFIGIGDAVHFPYGPVGTPADNLAIPGASYIDNIHNHLIGQR